MPLNFFLIKDPTTSAVCHFDFASPSPALFPVRFHILCHTARGAPRDLCST